MASTSDSAEVSSGRNVTVALFIMRLTEAVSTPGCFVSVFSMKDWHAAHVIPLTGNVTLLACSSFKADLLYGLHQVGRLGFGRICRDAGGSYGDVLNFDARQACEGCAHSPD